MKLVYSFNKRDDIELKKLEVVLLKWYILLKLFNIDNESWFVI